MKSTYCGKQSAPTCAWSDQRRSAPKGVWVQGGIEIPCFCKGRSKGQKRTRRETWTTRAYNRKHAEPAWNWNDEFFVWRNCFSINFHPLFGIKSLHRTFLLKATTPLLENLQEWTEHGALLLNYWIRNEAIWLWSLVHISNSLWQLYAFDTKANTWPIILIFTSK